MSEIKILPCPFCGGEAKTGYAINDYNRWGVICTSCEACVEVAEWKGVADTEENAIRMWNTRKSMQEIVESLEKEMRNAMQDYKDSSENYDLGVYQAFKDATKIVKKVGETSD